MHTIDRTLCSLLLLTAPAFSGQLGSRAWVPSSAATASVAAADPDSGGRVEWFEGTWDELLKAARVQNRVVFVDFWAEWCHWCKELDKQTFRDDAVAATLAKMLPYSVDVESEAGREIASRFSSGPMPLPTLLFLGPDGEPREAIQGFLPPEPFVAEANRILRDENTIGDLRRRLERDANDHEARWELATKLETVGDAAGGAQQRARLDELDPQRRSLPLRRVDLEELLANIGPELATERLERFLADETHGELLFRGWFFVGRVHDFRAAQAMDDGKTREADAHHAAALVARRRAWEHVLEPFVPLAGQEIAASILERAEAVSAADLRFALAVAERAAAAAPDDEALGATLADARKAVTALGAR